MRGVPDKHDNESDLEAQAVRDRLMADMEFQYSDIPAVSGPALFDDGNFVMTDDAFWFETPSGNHFHYSRKGGLVAKRPSQDQADEFELYLWGTVFGAVVWFHDLLPLHASAVARDGHVIAFTADSGGGKSTLAAALAAQGYDHVCDDTLVLSPQAEGVFALPDQKPLKLWRDSIDRVEVTKQEAISSVPGKSYANVKNVAKNPSRLAHLIFLEWGDSMEIRPVQGAAKLEHLIDAMYRPFVHMARDDADHHARLILEISLSVRFWRFQRPKKFDSLHTSVDFIDRHFSSLPDSPFA